MSSVSAVVETGIGAAGLGEQVNMVSNVLDDTKWQAAYQFWKANKRGFTKSRNAVLRSVGLSNSSHNAYNRLNTAAYAIEKNGKNGKNDNSYSIPKICKEMSASLIKEFRKEALRTAGKAATKSFVPLAKAAAEVAEAAEAASTLPPRNRPPRGAYTAKAMNRTSGIFGLALPDYFLKKELTSIDIKIIQSKINAFEREIRELQDNQLKFITKCKGKNVTKECGWDVVHQIPTRIREIQLQKLALEDLIKEAKAKAGAGSSGGKRKTRRNRKYRA
jgi:hypothetical protein